MIYLLGLAGPKGVGKSTVATALQDKLTPLWATRVHSFATALREATAAFIEAVSKLPHYGVVLPHLTHAKNELFYFAGMRATGRQFLVELGQACRRINPDFWVKIADRSIDWDADLLIIFDDVRFENEAMWIKERGGLVVELQREGIEYVGGETETPLPRHCVSATYSTLRTWTTEQAAEWLRKFMTESWRDGE